MRGFQSTFQLQQAISRSKHQILPQPHTSRPFIPTSHHDRPLLFPHLQPNVHRTARLLPRPTSQIRPLSFPRRSLPARPRRFFPFRVGGDHDGILLHVTPEQAGGRVSEVAVERVYIFDGVDQFGDDDQFVSSGRTTIEEGA
jgi:hypothetical protein